MDCSPSAAGASTLESLLRELAAQGATGVLEVQHGRTELSHVWLRDGEIYALSVPGYRPALGIRLLTSGIISPEELSSAVAEQRSRYAGYRIGEILVHLGHVPAEVIDSYVVDQVYDQLADLLDLPVISSTFHQGRKARQDTIAPRPVGSLLAVARERRRLWAPVLEEVGGPGVVPLLCPPVPGSGPGPLGPRELALMCRVDGHRDLTELARVCGLTLFECAQVVGDLAHAGVVELPEPADEDDGPLAPVVPLHPLARSGNGWALADSAPTAEFNMIEAARSAAAELASGRSAKSTPAARTAGAADQGGTGVWQAWASEPVPVPDGEALVELAPPQRPAVAVAEAEAGEGQGAGGQAEVVGEQELQGAGLEPAAGQPEPAGKQRVAGGKRHPGAKRHSGRREAGRGSAAQAKQGDESRGWADSGSYEPARPAVAAGAVADRQGALPPAELAPAAAQARPEPAGNAGAPGQDVARPPAPASQPTDRTPTARATGRAPGVRKREPSAPAVWIAPAPGMPPVVPVLAPIGEAPTVLPPAAVVAAAQPAQEQRGARVESAVLPETVPVAPGSAAVAPAGVPTQAPDPESAGVTSMAVPAVSAQPAPAPESLPDPDVIAAAVAAAEPERIAFQTVARLVPDARSVPLPPQVPNLDVADTAAPVGTPRVAGAAPITSPPAPRPAPSADRGPVTTSSPLTPAGSSAGSQPAAAGGLRETSQVGAPSADSLAQSPLPQRAAPVVGPPATAPEPVVSVAADGVGLVETVGLGMEPALQLAGADSTAAVSVAAVREDEAVPADRVADRAGPVVVEGSTGDEPVVAVAHGDAVPVVPVGLGAEPVAAFREDVAVPADRVADQAGPVVVEGSTGDEPVVAVAHGDAVPEVTVAVAAEPVVPEVGAGSASAEPAAAVAQVGAVPVAPVGSPAEPVGPVRAPSAVAAEPAAAAPGVGAVPAVPVGLGVKPVAPVVRPGAVAAAPAVAVPVGDAVLVVPVGAVAEPAGPVLGQGSVAAKPVVPAAGAVAPQPVDPVPDGNPAPVVPTGSSVSLAGVGEPPIRGAQAPAIPARVPRAAARGAQVDTDEPTSPSARLAGASPSDAFRAQPAQPAQVAAPVAEVARPTGRAAAVAPPEPAVGAPTAAVRESAVAASPPQVAQPPASAAPAHLEPGTGESGRPHPVVPPPAAMAPPVPTKAAAAAQPTPASPLAPTEPSVAPAAAAPSGRRARRAANPDPLPADLVGPEAANGVTAAPSGPPSGARHGTRGVPAAEPRPGPAPIVPDALESPAAPHPIAAQPTVESPQVPPLAQQPAAPGQAVRDLPAARPVPEPEPGQTGGRPAPWAAQDLAELAAFAAELAEPLPPKPRERTDTVEVVEGVDRDMLALAAEYLADEAAGSPVENLLDLEFCRPEPVDADPHVWALPDSQPDAHGDSRADAPPESQPGAAMHIEQLAGPPPAARPSVVPQPQMARPAESAADPASRAVGPSQAREPRGRTADSQRPPVAGSPTPPVPTQPTKTPPAPTPPGQTPPGQTPPSQSRSAAESQPDTSDFMRELSSLGSPETAKVDAPKVTRRVVPLKETKRKRRFWG